MSLSRLAIELGWFFAPVLRAARSGDALSDWLGRIGYDLDPAQAGQALNDLANLGQAVGALRGTIDAVVAAAADPSEIDEAAIAAAGAQVWGGIDGIVDVVRMVAGAPPGADFPSEVFDRLIEDYLAARLPQARALLAALDVRQVRAVPAGGPGGRDIDYDEVRYRWERLGLLFSDAGQWADEVYGWGRDFDHARAIAQIGALVETFGGRVRLSPVEQGVAAAFLANIPTVTFPAPGAVPEPMPITRARMPILTQTLPGPNGTIGASAEAGITVIPTGDFARPADMGLAIAPYAEGALGASVPLSPTLTFGFSADAQATGGVAVAIQPSGATVKGGGAVAASFEASFTWANADGSPMILIGAADGTRVQVDRILAALGGAMDGDFFVAGGAGGLSAVIDFGDDGLLGALIPEPMTITAGDILLGFRPGRGIYFEGGTSLELDIPVDIDLTVLRILGLGVALDWSDAFAIEVTVEAEVEIGPIYGYADGLGLRAEIVDRAGLLGERDIAFSFVPPTSYAVALHFAPVEGGGLISILEHEYRGALALKFETIGFSAFAILTTRLPGGRDGFSFAASIFAEFSVPLGYGFFLTGLGGMIGINRTLDTDAMREVLYDGRLDNLIFPADPIRNAASILDDMAAILPPREGQHVFGPVARISWGVPTLVSLSLGVVIEVGAEVRVLILGKLTSMLPTPETAIVSLNLSFFGEIDFAAGTVSFDATLQNSRILAFAVSGDAAIRTGWGRRIEHIVSFGGLHPAFPRPANLPELRRLTIAFGTNNPRVTLTSYTTVTLNSLQFGAEAQVYAEGPDLWLIGQLAAEGWAYFHALVILDPFAFTASLGGGIKLLRNGKVVCGLGFDLSLSGPNTFVIDGRVWVSVFGQDISFRIRHTWGGRQSLPPARADAVAALRAALEAARIEPVAAPARGAAVSFRTLDAAEAQPLDPQGGARIRQGAVPLAVTIDRLGEAQVSGARRLDLRLTRAGLPAAGSTAVEAEFVRGHFFAMTEAERLRATAYETLKAGATLAPAGLATQTARAVSEVYDYEIVPIPVRDTRAGGLAAGIGLIRPEALLSARLAQVAAEGILPRDIPRPDAPELTGDRFTTRAIVDSVIADGRLAAGDPLPQGGLFGTYAEARAVLAETAAAVGAVTADPRAAPEGPGGRGGALPDYVSLAGAMGIAA